MKTLIKASSDVLFLLILIYLFNSCKKQQIPVVTTGTVSGSNIEIIFNGNVLSNGGTVVHSAGACWSNIITVPTVDNNCANSTDNVLYGGQFTCPVSMLTPGTTYYLRAIAVNFTGVGYGDVVSCTTTGSVTGDIIFNPSLKYGTVSDIDGNIYKTIQIGSQTWTAENLKTTKYSDGADIPNVTDLVKWRTLVTPAFCWYLNDASKYKQIYGALYNWYTVNTGKLCPTGWHVPSDDEWTTLTTYLGGDTVAAERLKESGETHWIDQNSSVTNSSGFTALPGGMHVITDGTPQWYFSELGYIGYFWSSTEFIENSGSSAALRNFHTQSKRYDRAIWPKEFGFSVRCMKN